MNNKELKNKSVALATVVLMLGNSSFVFADNRVTKDETVYSILDENGNVDKNIVSAWINSSSSLGTIHDVSTLSNIKNVKGTETPKKDGDKLTWKVSEDDLYYQGETNKSLPLSVNIKYELNGVETTAKDMQGKSGKFKITLSIKNNESREVEINGKTRTLYVPFVTASEILLDRDNFKDITTSTGALLDEGSHSSITFVSIPGFKESLDLDSEYSDYLNLKDEIVIEGNTTGFKTPTIMVAATSDVSKYLEDIDEDTDLSDLKDSLQKLQDGGKDLVDGAKQVDEGASTLNTNYEKFNDGVKSLDEGITTLNNGASELLTKLPTLDSGAKTLSSGLGTLSSGASDLNTGASSLHSGAKTLTSGLGTLNTGASDLNTGASSLYSGAKTLTSGLSTLNKGASDLNSQYTELDTGINSAYEGTKALKQGSSKLKSGAESLESGLSSGSEGIKELSSGLNTVSGYIKQISSGLRDEASSNSSNSTTIANSLASIGARAQANGDIETLKDIKTIEAILKSQADNANNAAVNLDSIADKLDSTASLQEGGTLYEFSKKINFAVDGSKELVAGLTDLDSHLSDLESGLENASKGSSLVSSGLQQLAGGASDAYNGSKTLTSGASALSDGASKLAGGTSDAYKGSKTLTSGASALSDGASKLASGASDAYNGSKDLTAGTSALVEGGNKLGSGVGALKSGSTELRTNSDKILEGIGTLADGTTQLFEGAEKLQTEGLDKIYDAGDTLISSLDDAIEIKDKLVDMADNYDNFTGLDKNMDGSVKFVMKVNTDNSKNDSNKSDTTSTENNKSDNDNNKKSGFGAWLKGLFNRK